MDETDTNDWARNEWAEHDPTIEPITTVFRDIVLGEPPF